MVNMFNNTSWLLSNYLINFFFTGGGGVGKTYLIKLLSQWAEYILQKPGDVTYYPKVIRLAATGSAAQLIGNIQFPFFIEIILIEYLNI